MHNHTVLCKRCSQEESICRERLLALDSTAETNAISRMAEVCINRQVEWPDIALVCSGSGRGLRVESEYKTSVHTYLKIGHCPSLPR